MAIPMFIITKGATRVKVKDSCWDDVRIDGVLRPVKLIKGVDRGGVDTNSISIELPT